MSEEQNFGWALNMLKKGKGVTRIGWNGVGQFIELQTPTELSKMTKPYLFIHTVQGNLVPWLASQTDILATDWELVMSEITPPSLNDLVREILKVFPTNLLKLY